MAADERQRWEAERDRSFVRERDARREISDILESITDAFFALDRERRFTYVNRRAEEFWDRPREELLGHCIWETFPEAVGSEPYRQLEKALEENVAANFEAISPVSHTWFSSRIYPSPDGVLVFFQDISERKEAEEALRESEERYRTLFDSIDEGFGIIEMLYDEKGRAVDYLILETNPAFGRMTGFADAAGKTSLELNPDAEPYWFETLGRVAQTGEDVRFESYAEALDRWFDVYASRVGGEGSRRVAIVFTNTTERKRAEEALRESEERFRTLVENIRDYAIFMLDADGVVTEWTEGARRVKGYAAEEVLGRHVSMFYAPEEIASGDPEGELAQAAEEGRAEREGWRVHKDGERIWVNEIATAVRGEGGNLVGFTKISRDLTERRRAEEALRVSEERLQRALAIETVGVIFFKTDGSITDSNDAFLRMSGYNREDLAEGLLRWDVMTPPEWMPHSLKALEELQTTGRTTPYQKEYIRKDGSRWWALFAATRLNEEEGVEFVIDITARKRTEAERERLIAHELTARAQAEERRRLSRELHDRVAHDIALVHQSLELHEVLKSKDPERAVAKMELARRIVKEALESIRDLSIELREPEVRRGLEAALANLLRDLVPPTVASSLSVEGDETLVQPEIRNQLFLILREAIRNTVTHSEAARIAVELDIGRERVVGRVEDDGRGFDPDEVRTAGTGGLRAMEERATLVGGTLDLSSAPGRGTTVTVFLSLGDA